MTEMTIEQRIAVVKENIDRVGGSGRVTLVGVAKTKPAELVRRAIAGGLDVIGENYVQELRDKSQAGAYEGAAVHMIGHLQTNKVKYVAGKVALIQSVDSPALLEAISRRAAALNTVQDVLIEVNIGGEAGKSGVAPEALDEMLQSAAGFPGVRVRGLMAIPPAENTRAYFGPMYHLFVDNKAKKYDNNVVMDFLSMGMSDDYEDAIKEGANMVRVGSFIFGARNYGVTR
ncbi:MAG: YggS family pyridoxal phosphate-dependent enzyme [Oscillospiraceae bacterium]|nr:YggS family pyridoxal phosphate-dependent enzyme [Oscillospiraceae bacterium]